MEVLVLILVLLAAAYLAFGLLGDILPRFLPPPDEARERLKRPGEIFEEKIGAADPEERKREEELEAAGREETEEASRPVEPPDQADRKTEDSRRDPYQQE